MSTDLSVELDCLERFASSMLLALTRVFDSRLDAGKAFAVLETALPRVERVECGRLLVDAEEERICRRLVDRELIRRASTVLLRVLAAEPQTFASFTLTSRASRPELERYASVLRKHLATGSK